MKIIALIQHAQKKHKSSWKKSSGFSVLGLSTLVGDQETQSSPPLLSSQESPYYIFDKPQGQTAYIIESPKVELSSSSYRCQVQSKRCLVVEVVHKVIMKWSFPSLVPMKFPMKIGSAWSSCMHFDMRQMGENRSDSANSFWKLLSRINFSWTWSSKAKKDTFRSTFPNILQMFGTQCPGSNWLGGFVLESTNLLLQCCLLMWIVSALIGSTA